MRGKRLRPYPDDARPGCLVWVDGAWTAGRLQAWEVSAQGWTAVVAYFSAADVAFVVKVPMDRVRGPVPPV